MNDVKQIHPFIDYLYSLTQEQRRDALADLRRGLSETPGTSPVMFPYVARWVPENVRYSWREKVYYLIAALFAYYQSGGDEAGKRKITEGNMGDHCLSALRNLPQSDSFELRFSALLKTNSEDLPVILRQMISLLKTANIPINWDQLFYDLSRWNSESHHIQRRWANNYWGNRHSPEDNNKNQ